MKTMNGAFKAPFLEGAAQLAPMAKSQAPSQRRQDEEHTEGANDRRSGRQVACEGEKKAGHPAEERD